MGTQPMSASIPDIVKSLKRASRELYLKMRRGGFHSSRKGKRVYTRKTKHKGDPEK